MDALGSPEQYRPDESTVMTVYYVAGMEANFHELRDALYAASEESIRTCEEQTVMIYTGSQEPYRYCLIRKGDQA